MWPGGREGQRWVGPVKFGLYSPSLAPHGAALIYLFHGQSEKETSVKDVEAQAPQAPQIEPAQKAYVAEISLRAPF